MIAFLGPGPWALESADLTVLRAVRERLLGASGQDADLRKVIE